MDYFFERLDLNNSGTICLDEFRDNLLGKDAIQNKKEFDSTMHEVYG